MLHRIGIKTLFAAFALAAVCAQPFAQTRSTLEIPLAVTSERQVMLQPWFDKIEVLDNFKEGTRTFRLIEPHAIRMSDIMAGTPAYWMLDVKASRDDSIDVYCFVVVIFKEACKEKFMEIYDEHGAKIEFTSARPIIAHEPILKDNKVTQILVIKVTNALNWRCSGKRLTPRRYSPHCSIKSKACSM